MTSTCAVVRESFGDYLRDALPPSRRRTVREHLAGCAECRSTAVESEPTMLFARDLRPEIPAEEAERILATVRTGISLIEAERRTDSGRAFARRRFLGAAAAVFAALMLLEPGGATRPPEREAARPSAPEPEIARWQPAALPAEARASPSEATVYDWNPGAGREEPRVVWIVDRGLDI